MATMLQLVQQACNELGLSSPNSVAGNTNQDVIQILALLNASGYEILHRYEWNALTTEYRFTTEFYTYTGDTTNGSTSVTGMSSIANLDTTFMVTGTGINQDTFVSSASGTTVVLSQAASATGTSVSLTFSKTKYSMPSDYDRLVNRTDWDKSKKWEMLGPETAQQWQWLKSGYIATGPRVRYRVLGGYFQIWPPLNTNDYLGFEYVSKNWALSSSGTAQSSFTADDDTSIYRDRLLVLSTKKKYFEIKGFDSTAFTRDYERELELAMSQDQGAPTLALSPKPSDVLIGWENIPDSGYGT